MICVRNFLEFLSEYRCLGAYWANFEKSHFADDYSTAAMTISLVFENCPRLWLMKSFNWELSKEGIEFWSRLNANWAMRCDFLLKNED